MQRRLTLALVSLTLFAVILVGVGVLAFAQVGARHDTETVLGTRLESVASLTEDIPNLDRLGPAINRLGRTFGDGNIQMVVVSPTGIVSSASNFSGGLAGAARANGSERATSNGNNAAISLAMTPTELADFQSGSMIFLDNGRAVTGVRLLDVEAPRLAERGLQVGILGQQSIARVSGDAKRWFVISAALVLLTSVLAASLLSRRLVAPVRAIQSTTNRLARGDLSTRVDVHGSDEIAELGHSVNQMASDLERSKQLEQQFLLSVSHDLRTPLTSIRGYAEALTDGAIDDPADAGRIIQNHADRLGRLVTDLLDLAKLDARQFQIKPQHLDVTEFVTQTTAGLVPTATQHDLHLTTSGQSGLSIHADPDRLAQIISNLVENAIKYARSTVRVQVGLRDGSPNSSTGPLQVSITVSDDGPGIPDKDLPHIFERLYVTQLRPVREESSSGLGLAIVHELTEAMGGTVRAERGAEGGTAVVLTFDLTNQGLITP